MNGKLHPLLTLIAGGGINTLRMKGRLAAVIGVVVLSAAAFTSQASAAVNFYATGSPGTWTSIYSETSCTGSGSWRIAGYQLDGTPYRTFYGSTPSVTTVAPWVTTSAAYVNYSQTIYLMPMLQASQDGVNWYTISGTTQQMRTSMAGTRTGISFNSETLNLSNLVAAGYHYFKFFSAITWYVGSTQVGFAFYGNTANETFIANDTGAQGLNTNDSRSPFGCYIP